MTGSLGTGWRTLRGSADRVLVPTLVLSTAGVAVHVVLQYLLGAAVAGSSECARPFLDQVLTARCGPSNGRSQLTLVLGILALYAVGQLVVAGLYRATLDAVDEVPVRGPFTGWLSTKVLAAALLAAVLMTVNTVVLVVPAIVLGFLIRYAPLFVLDQGLGPVPAMVASTRFVVADLAAELWFAVKAALLLVAAALLLGLGLYLAVPVVLIAQTQRYRARV